MDWDFASEQISDCGLGFRTPHWRWRFAGQRNSDSLRLVISLHFLSWDHGQATWLASKADIKTGSLISRAFSISSFCMITTYSLKLSCVILYLTKPMTWSWGGGEEVLMTLIFNSQRSISGEPIGPDKKISNLRRRQFLFQIFTYLLHHGVWTRSFHRILDFGCFPFDNWSSFSPQ